MADSKGKSSHIHQHNPISTPPLPSSFHQAISSMLPHSRRAHLPARLTPSALHAPHPPFKPRLTRHSIHHPIINLLYCPPRSPHPPLLSQAIQPFESSQLDQQPTPPLHPQQIETRKLPKHPSSDRIPKELWKSLYALVSIQVVSSNPPIAANTPGSSIPLSPDSPSKKGNQSRFSKPSSQNNIQLDQSILNVTILLAQYTPLTLALSTLARNFDDYLARSNPSVQQSQLPRPSALPPQPSAASFKLNSTARSSRSKKKGRSIASEKTNESSFDSIPAILPRFSRSSEVNLPLDSRLSYLKQPDTLASIYMVCGLPKNSQCWSLAQPDYLPSHLPGAVPRFWRPEVLGTTISGEEIISSHIDGPGESSGRNNDFGSESISKEELSKIQSKAVKLAFAREVEVIASTVQPPSTTHCSRLRSRREQRVNQSATGREDLLRGLSAGMVHSDRSRAEAIRKTLEEGSKAKSAAVVQAIKAAAAGRKLGTRLEKAVGSPMGFLPSSTELSSNASRPQSSHHAHSIVESSDTEENECFFSDSDWETGTEVVSDKITSGLLNNPVGSTTLFTTLSPPIHRSGCLTEMLKMLNFTLPKSLSIIKLPVGSSKESNTNFVVKLPGKKDLSNGGLEEVNFTMWPLFKCLSLSHIISIYEIGLSPMGRIVFFSSHPPILNIAVESFKLLLELRGWTGLCQSIIHSRDSRFIWKFDPGPFILGANSQLRHIASDISPEIMVVDLDTDTIRCPKPHPDALSKGPVRMKIEKSGRFRPFSAVEIKDQPSEAERLLPPPEWNWSQTRTIIILMTSCLKLKGLGKILKRTTNRQAAVLDSSALHVQEIIRKHTIRLSIDGHAGKQDLEIEQTFTDMLSTESQDLKTRLENERREHHTLTGVVAEQKSRQVELESRLLETEKAWMAAQVELAKAQEIREELQRQKEIMVRLGDEINCSRGDDENMLGQIVPRIGSFIGPTPSRRSSMAPTRRISLTTQNLRRLSAQARLTSPSPSPSPSSTRLEPHEESECETDSPLYKLASTGGGYSNFLGGDSILKQHRMTPMD
ncbi:hypothetical protein KEM48_008544 [Puccinia striiformis f. sp. tritici PST-130]|nr:hypothetical protein KEM48_008544 [Puccinia striiformis f. sp. tritici PST-130]